MSASLVTETLLYIIGAAVLLLHRFLEDRCMKKYLTAYQMTQSMFCAIPVPFRAWSEDARSCMLFFLPLVGLEIGGLWLLADKILVNLTVPAQIYALVMCLLPYLISGMIHFDGFLDVTDAMCSCRDLQKRREILKDSHVGSFAVVWCVFVMLSGYASFSTLMDSQGIFCLVFIPVISRCCSALAVYCLKPMSSSQYASTTNYPGWHKIFFILLITACAVTAYIITGRYALCFLIELICYGFTLRTSYKSLDGMNGDISGFCLTLSELSAVIALTVLR